MCGAYQGIRYLAENGFFGKAQISHGSSDVLVYINRNLSRRPRHLHMETQFPENWKKKVREKMSLLIINNMSENEREKSKCMKNFVYFR